MLYILIDIQYYLTVNHLFAEVRVQPLTYWCFLIGEECGAIATIHVSHANVVPIRPVELPDWGIWHARLAPQEKKDVNEKPKSHFCVLAKRKRGASQLTCT